MSKINSSSGKVAELNAHFEKISQNTTQLLKEMIDALRKGKYKTRLKFTPAQGYSKVPTIEVTTSFGKAYLKYNSTIANMRSIFVQRDLKAEEVLEGIRYFDIEESVEGQSGYIRIHSQHNIPLQEDLFLLRDVITAQEKR